MRIIDLSVPLRNFSFDTQEQEIKYIDHNAIARRQSQVWGVEVDWLPNPGHHQSFEYVYLSSHAGTHIDAPSHYGSAPGGKIGRNVDEIPLEWCYGDGFLLDFAHIPPTQAITLGDARAELERIGYSVKAGDICLIRTGADRYINENRYRHMGAGITVELCHWLIDQGVMTIGTDSVTLDMPHYIMVEKMKAGDRSAWFPVHYVGREKEYLQIEKLGNLDQLPRPTGFKVACFPVKIEHGSGGWCRAVAIFEDL